MPTTHRKVLLKGKGEVRLQHAAGGAITPGHLVQLGSAGTVVVHATAGGNAAPDFALEEDFHGDDVGDAYATGDQVQHALLSPGDRVYALIAANAAAIVVGDYLESAGNGALRKAIPLVVASDSLLNPATIIYTHNIVARALEALDNSAVGAQARLAVEII